jgi:hypothetical protein
LVPFYRIEHLGQSFFVYFGGINMAKKKTDIKKDNPEKLKGNETPNL